MYYVQFPKTARHFFFFFFLANIVQTGVSVNKVICSGLSSVVMLVSCSTWNLYMVLDTQAILQYTVVFGFYVGFVYNASSFKEINQTLLFNCTYIHVFACDANACDFSNKSHTIKKQLFLPKMSCVCSPSFCLSNKIDKHWGKNIIVHE